MCRQGLFFLFVPFVVGRMLTLLNPLMDRRRAPSSGVRSLEAGLPSRGAPPSRPFRVRTKGRSNRGIVLNAGRERKKRRTFGGDIVRGPCSKVGRGRPAIIRYSKANWHALLSGSIFYRADRQTDRHQADPPLAVLEGDSASNNRVSSTSRASFPDGQCYTLDGQTRTEIRPCNRSLSDTVGPRSGLLTAKRR